MTQGITVTTGAPWATSVDAGPFRVTCASFDAGFDIPSHFHDYGCLSVIVEGGFHQAFPRAEFECPPGGVIVKPPGERHIDRWGSRASRHVIVEPKALRDPEDPAERVFHSVSFRIDPRAIGLARRLYEELEAGDDLSALSAEALALELVVLASRASGTGAARGRAPDWLQRSREALADTQGRVSIRDVASIAGVHPSRLAREFRRHFGVTPGAYVRRLRVERARADLERGRESISTIALRHGYADQSHFTRDFRSATGLTPAAYRRGHRGAN